MEPIELSRWEPSPEDPRRKQYAGQRTAQEVFEELRHRLEGMGYLPDEYFLMNRDWENGREIPRGADIFCTTDYGGSEGIYLDVSLQWYENDRTVTRNFITGKTLGETGADLDRMFLISSAITKAFHGDRGTYARYLSCGEQPEPEAMIVHLDPAEQRTIIQALVEQRERQEQAMSQTEQLLRRMTGSITAYMEEVGQRPLRMSDYDKTVLAIQDGELTEFWARYWQTTSIQYVLHNEKYAGDSLAQKTYTTRTLPHRKKRNQGEYDQYFVPGSHPAIIDRELFDRAQALLKQKGAVIHPKSGVTYPWTGTVICGQCGSIFKRKKCRESAYWTCRLHDKSPDKCQITQIPESEFERAFLRLYYKLRHHGMPVLSQLLTDLQTAQNRKLLWSLDIVELNKQIADIVRQERLLAELKQQGLVDPDIYITRSNTLAEQLRTAKLEKERFLESEEDQTIRQTQVLLEILETGPEFLEAFDEELFSELVAKIIVENNECLRFRLINGLELTETIERTVR